MAELKYAAWDLEIATPIPEGTEDWSELRPLGISCAAVSKVPGAGGEPYTRVWHGGETPEGRYVERMSPTQCRMMAGTLMALQALGFTLVTFNGCGFDLDVLAEECDDAAVADAVRRLAREHVDIAFAFFAEKGFMCGLAKAALAMGLGGKTEGMSGALAPDMWAGTREDQELVLEYVERDAVLTGELYEAVLEEGKLRWVTSRGHIGTWRPRAMGEAENGATRLLTVQEAMQLPEPDMSWAGPDWTPWEREKFVGWLEP